MAAKLNKTRIRDTRIVVLVSFLIILFTKQIFDHDDELIHEPIEFFGYFLIAICAIGRVYCTAFLGGMKNREIIDYGPFSICRNPLYMFSFIGVVGFALMTVNIAVLILLPTSFLLIYISLIKREEAYLEEKFGQVYAEYKSKTPRLFPNFKLYHAPETVEMTPRTLLRSVGDSAMWFLAYPLIEFVEYLQEAQILKPFIYINF